MGSVEIARLGQVPGIKWLSGMDQFNLREISLVA